MKKVSPITPSKTFHIKGFWKEHFRRRDENSLICAPRLFPLQKFLEFLEPFLEKVLSPRRASPCPYALNLSISIQFFRRGHKKRHASPGVPSHGMRRWFRAAHFIGGGGSTSARQTRQRGKPLPPQTKSRTGAWDFSQFPARRNCVHFRLFPSIPLRDAFPHDFLPHLPEPLDVIYS